jgi:hypothetical protein
MCPRQPSFKPDLYVTWRGNWKLAKDALTRPRSNTTLGRRRRTSLGSKTKLTNAESINLKIRSTISWTSKGIALAKKKIITPANDKKSSEISPPPEKIRNSSSVECTNKFQVCVPICGKSKIERGRRPLSVPPHQPI